MSQTDRMNNILLNMGRPDIYRINSFRLLNLPITTTNKDIKKIIHKNELMHKYAINKANENVNETENGNEFKEKALQRILNPELRFIDEFFWYWPSAENTNVIDNAISAVINKKLPEAVSIWGKREQNGSESYVSTHNLAVCYHALALDIDKREIEKNPVNDEQKIKRAKYWELALSRWRLLLKNNNFWQRVQQRVDYLNDPRINYQTIEQIKNQLPQALLMINAAMALEYSKINAIDNMKLHINLMNESGFESELITDALYQTLNNARNTLKTICANSAEETNNCPSNGYEINNNLISDARKSLFHFNRLLPQDDALKESVHDEIALQIRSGAHSYAKATENWENALILLTQALRIAGGISAKRKIEEDITTINNLLTYTTCWFCGKPAKDTSAMAEVVMYGDVQEEKRFLETRVRWHNIRIPVPRCVRCKNAHSTRHSIGCGGLAFGALAGLFMGVALQEVFHGVLVAIITFAIISFLAYLLSVATFPPGIKTEDHKMSFPKVLEMINNGWNVGEKPSNVS
jgi:hypothetical protein